MSTEEKKEMTNEEFAHIMDVMKRSHATLPLEYYISILGDLVTKSTADSEEVKKLAEVFKDLPIEEIITKTVLVTANSIVTSIWGLFGKKLEELAAESDKMEAEPVEEEHKA